MYVLRKTNKKGIHAGAKYFPGITKYNHVNDKGLLELFFSVWRTISERAFALPMPLLQC